jgi:hypothetical protein
VAAEGPHHRLIFYFQADGTIPWISEAVAGSGTAYSAPGTTYNSIGNLVTAAGPGNGLSFWWQAGESGPGSPSRSRLLAASPDH